jgi:hypothetical protein
LETIGIAEHGNWQTVRWYMNQREITVRIGAFDATR